MLIFLAGIASAANVCSDTNQIIFRLRGNTNTHAEVFNGAGGYTTEVCYNQIFSRTGTGDRNCYGNNKVLGLSRPTNAHVEGPAETTIGYQDVCYDDLSCSLETSGSCSSGYPVARLFSNRNAHLGTFSGSSYATILCCSSAAAPTGCNPPCQQGETCQSGTCVAGPGPGPAQCSDGLDNDGDTKIDYPDDIGCTDVNDDNENNVVIPPVTGGDAYWEDDSGNKYANNAEVEVSTWVKLVAENVLDGSTVTFNVWDYDFLDPFGDDSIDTFTATAIGTKAEYLWQINQDDYDKGGGEADPIEFYFIATATGYNKQSPELHVTTKILPVQKQFCSDYTPDEYACNADALGLAKNKNDPLYYIDPSCDNSNVKCKCGVESNKCDLRKEWTDPNPDPGKTACVGECSYKYNKGDCNNGMMDINVIASFTAKSGDCDANSAQKAECTNKDTSVTCGSPELQLPLFGMWQLIISIMGIAAIYGFLSLKRRN